MRGFVLAVVTTAALLSSRPARAEITPPRRVDLSTPTRRQVSELCTASARAMMRGDAAAALGFAEKAVALDANDAWAHYDRAVALANLNRVDEAVAEYRLAQARFGAAADEWGQSIAIYGRAHLYAEHQRCEEAEAGYEEYASFVSKDAPKEAEMALSYASDCPLPGAKPAVSSNEALSAAGARVALAEARRREHYAETLDRWVTRVEASSPIATRPGAQARLEAVRQRVEKLAASARDDEHAAEAKLSRTR